jgi:iron complex transport system substrate-binding protein
MPFSAVNSRDRTWLAIIIAVHGMMTSALSLAAEGAPGPRHVISLSECTDALLLDLLPPQRIASVTYLAHRSVDPRLAARAARVGINFGNSEEVLAEAPDLVLAGTYSTPAARALLRQLQAPMLVVPPANNFEEIRSSVRAVASALDVAERGEALLSQMDATLAAVALSRPARSIRVAAWNGSGYVPGKDSLFNAVLEAAGGSNIAATGGLGYGSVDIEQLLTAQPEVLAYGAEQDAPALVTDTAEHPLLMRLYASRRITYPQLYVECGLPESANAAQALQTELLAVLHSTMPKTQGALAP